jgi:hypothetical protein
MIAGTIFHDDYIMSINIQSCNQAMMLKILFFFKSSGEQKLLHQQICGSFREQGFSIIQMRLLTDKIPQIYSAPSFSGLLASCTVCPVPLI